MTTALIRRPTLVAVALVGCALGCTPTPTTPPAATTKPADHADRADHDHDHDAAAKQDADQDHADHDDPKTLPEEVAPAAAATDDYDEAAAIIRSAKKAEADR